MEGADCSNAVSAGVTPSLIVVAVRHDRNGKSETDDNGREYGGHEYEEQPPSGWQFFSPEVSGPSYYGFGVEPDRKAIVC